MVIIKMVVMETNNTSQVESPQSLIENKQENIENKTIKCLNCGNEFQGKFCPDCGQSAETKRFTVKFIFVNLLAAILSNDGGVWFTFKKLFTHPDKMIVDILDGKRKSYFSPFPMLFLTLAVYVLIYSFTGSNDFQIDDASGVAEAEKISFNVSSIIYEINNFYYNHFTLVYILSIPIALLSVRCTFGKTFRKKYNWGETCVALVYSCVQIFVLKCVSSIIYAISPVASEKAEDVIKILVLFSIAWCFKKLVNLEFWKMLFRSLLSRILFWAILGPILTVIFVGYAYTFHHEEVMQFIDAVKNW